jgi:sugar lactone lactonase YvrE
MRLPTFAIVLVAMQPSMSSAQAVRSLPSEDRPLAIDIDEVYRVGGAAAQEWATFGRVSDVRFDRQGRLYIADSRNQRIVVVGSTGDLVRVIGRRGDGPGEFQAPSEIAVSPSGRLFVLDAIGRHYQAFDRDGRFLQRFRVPAELGRGGSFEALDDSTLIGAPPLFVVNGRLTINGSVSDDPPAYLPLYRVDLARGGATRIGQAWLAPRPTPREPFATHAFVPRVHWIQWGNSVALADTTSYLVESVDPGL